MGKYLPSSRYLRNIESNSHWITWLFHPLFLGLWNMQVSTSWFPYLVASFVLGPTLSELGISRSTWIPIIILIHHSLCIESSEAHGRVIDRHKAHQYLSAVKNDWIEGSPASNHLSGGYEPNLLGCLNQSSSCEPSTLASSQLRWSYLRAVK